MQDAKELDHTPVVSKLTGKEAEMERRSEVPLPVHDPNICSPISSLAHVWTYAENPPKWIDRIIDLVPRGNSIIKNAISDCHVEANCFVPKTRLECHSVPRTLVCHDMKGGYLEDKYIGSINIGNGYTFYRWAQIDIFVYFSHHLITIPPLSWINIAHANGVKILGTFITEWNPGREICNQILENSRSIKMFVDFLVDISVLFKLDGWLINIENDLEETDSLKQLIKRLTTKLHIKRPGSLVIWYDSVIQDGKLKWQNELNDLNRCFFDLCDGIFINYSWSENNLKKTAKAAEHRRLDVYVGVDVFGRNFYGGGNFNTYLAAEKIRQYNLSMAVFAQAWTHESIHHDPTDTLLERFLTRDNAFWRSLWPWLYTHPLTRPFETFFYIGVDQDWFKLHSQEIQLSHFLHSKEPSLEDRTVPTLLGTCNCLQLCLQDRYTSCVISKENLEFDTSYVHHLFSCDIQINSKIIVYFYMKQIQTAIPEHLSLVLLVKYTNGTYQKVICHSKLRKDTIDNFSLLEINPAQDENVLNMIRFKNNVPNEWVLRCYIINISDCRILEIGAKLDEGVSGCLCGIGFVDAAVLRTTGNAKNT